MKVNRTKTHLAPSNRTQDITGVNVNGSQSISNTKYQKVRMEIMALASETTPVNVRRYRSAWGKVHHVKYVDEKKGEKLETLAKEKLLHLKTYDGPKLKNVRTRSCKSIRAKH